MPISIPGGHVFEPADLALLRRAFALAADVADGPFAGARDRAARRLFADFAAGERDVAVLADRARLRLVERPPGVGLEPRRPAATT
jgi:hypothetical protein